MSQVVNVVIQICLCWLLTGHPNLIARFQVQRRLDGQRTELISDVVCLFNITHPDSTPVQIKNNIQINIEWWWWRWKFRQSREGEKINSRSRCREYSRRQIHGVSLVHHRQIERNNSSCGEKWIALDVKMDGRRFDVSVSNPFLKIF